MNCEEVLLNAYNLHNKAVLLKKTEPNSQRRNRLLSSKSDIHFSLNELHKSVKNNMMLVKGTCRLHICSLHSFIAKCDFSSFDRYFRIAFDRKPRDVILEDKMEKAAATVERVISNQKEKEASTALVYFIAAKRWQK